jgi:hypothetical protein
MSDECGMCNGTRRVKAASDLLARSPRDHAEYLRQIEEGPDYPCPVCAIASASSVAQRDSSHD